MGQARWGVGSVGRGAGDRCSGRRAWALRLIPETGNAGVGGGAYLLLDTCPGCGTGPHARGEVPMVAITGLADLGNYQHAQRLHLDPPPVPVEFFDDPAHAPDCPLRSPTTPHNTEHDSTEHDGM